MEVKDETGNWKYVCNNCGIECSSDYYRRTNWLHVVDGKPLFSTDIDFKDYKNLDFCSQECMSKFISST